MPAQLTLLGPVDEAPFVDGDDFVRFEAACSEEAQSLDIVIADRQLRCWPYAVPGHSQHTRVLPSEAGGEAEAHSAHV